MSSEVTKNVKRAWVFDYKLARGCTNCGFKHPAALQFHHVAKNKIKAVVDLVNNGVSLRTVMAEVAKCILLCANCHAIKHYVPRFPSLPPGTLNFELSW